MEKYKVPVFIRRTTIKIFFVLITILLFSCHKNESVTFDFSPDKTKTLTVFSTLNKDETQMLTSEFEHRTGIWVKTICSNPTRIHENIISSKNQQADILLCNYLEAVDLFKETLTEDVKNNTTIPRLFGNKAVAAVCSTPIGIFYNPYFISSEKINTWIQDIRNLKKIAVEGTVLTTENYECLYTLISVYQKTIPNFKIEDTDLKLLKTYGYPNEMATAVSDGSVYAILIPENKAVQLKQDYPSIHSVFLIPKKPATVYQVCSILKNTENQENAERFVDFLQSRETQQFLEDQLHYHSARTDINRQHINSWESESQNEMKSMSIMHSKIQQLWIHSEKGTEK